MPCNSITTQTVNLKNAMFDLVHMTLKKQGYTISSMEVNNRIVATTYGTRIEWVKGQGLTVTGYNNQQTIKEITKAYSATAVCWAAKRAGWQVQTAAADQLTVTRR